MVSACTCCLVTFFTLFFLSVFILAIYLLFSGLSWILDINFNFLFSWISYYIAGPSLVAFIILVYLNVNKQQAPYDLGHFEGKKISYINSKILDYVLYKLMLLLFFWGMYYAVNWIDYYVPLYGVNILYEFGKGLFCSLLSVSRIDIVDLEARTFTSNFIAFYGSLHIFLKGLETLGY